MKSRVLFASVTFAAVAAASPLLWIYGASEWKMNRKHDAPLEALGPGSPDPSAGRHVAGLVGCWAGCHGKDGGGGLVTIGDKLKITAPTLSQVLPAYSDEELVRLIRYGVKRDGTSAVGMSSYTFWALGREDLRNIIAFIRAQPPLPVIQRQRELAFLGAWRWRAANGRCPPMKWIDRFHVGASYRVARQTNEAAIWRASSARNATGWTSAEILSKAGPPWSSSRAMNRRIFDACCIPALPWVDGPSRT
jgi:hypothetical protein